MARSIWSGNISFGLVNVPVKLYSATIEKSVKFHQINSATGNRIAQKRVDKETGAEVEWEQLAKGYELTPERMVVVIPEELDAIAPRKTKMIGLESFVDAGELDPICFVKTYYVGPGDATAGTGKAYRLLSEAMARAGKVGIGRFVMRSKESLAALRVTDEGVLIVNTLLFADEVLPARKIVDVDEIEGEASEPEVKMAEALIESLSTSWDHSAYKDTYRAEVLGLIEKKAAGEKVELPDEPVAAPAPDLMAALAASLEANKANGKPAAKKAPAKRAPRKTKAAA